jgi:hypothetical protein
LGGLLSGPFDPGAMTGMLITAGAMVTGLLIAITGIVFGTWQSIAKTRAETALKHEMIARGMSADEIAQVLGTQPGGPVKVEGAIDLPCACEAVVRDSCGEWNAALVLQAAEGRYLVHYVGTEMDENEWVEAGRIRLAADSQLHDLIARLRPEFSRNGTTGKPPVEAEI